MYKKGAGNDKQGKDAGNRTLYPYRNFSQAIVDSDGILDPISSGYNTSPSETVARKRWNSCQKSFA